jgi:hypothetical protein
MSERSFSVDRCPRCGAALRRRTTEKNARLHATLSEIAAQKQWAGQWRDIETWKRLLVAAWTRARGEHATILPAIDGQGVDVLYRRTSRLTQEEIRDLIDYVESWAIDQGVVLKNLSEMAA